MPPISNDAIANTLVRYADLLEISGESAFRGRAFRRAAEVFQAWPEPIVEVQRAGRLQTIDGIGPAIAAAVADLVRTGEFRPLVELGERLPLTLLDLLLVPGLGVKTATRLYQELGITDLAALEDAIVGGRLRGLRGMGAKTEANLLAGLEALKRRSGRTRLGVALPFARDLADAIRRALPPGSRVAIAGSVRRMTETVGDIDLVVGAAEIEQTRTAITRLRDIELIEDDGPNVRLKLANGLTADVYVVAPSTFGSALVRATGAEAHLDLLGALPEHQPDERAVYAALGLTTVPPELREGHDEIILARTGGAPDPFAALVAIDDVRGEFHSHTTWSDGARTVAEMAKAAAARGYRFLGISDHTHGLGVANGLDSRRLAAQRLEIDRVNANGAIRLFAGAEVEVDRDGKLDFDDATLATLDVVIASLHVGLRQPRTQLMERLIGVLSNPHVDIIAHPSGRLIEQREGGDFDWDLVFATAARTGTALEINADPARLDLNGELARRAIAAGCLLTINCDAHTADGFGLLEYGVATARRAGATPRQILNCWDVAEIEAWLRDRARPADAAR